MLPILVCCPDPYGATTAQWRIGRNTWQGHPWFCARKAISSATASPRISALLASLPRCSKAALVPEEKLPPRDSRGRTVWVTRARPKIDRIACPWLIRRFVDPSAVFLFVPAAEVAAVADRFNATPFDIEAVYWSHRGELCTFDVMVEEFGLVTDPMLRLATIVRGADTSRPDLAPEVPGLLAASLGLSRMFNDDLEQLAAGMTLYDAFYRWCRDATDETHNWPNPRKA